MVTVEVSYTYLNGRKLKRSYLLHADIVALFDSAAHAVVPLGHVHRAPVVPAGAHAAFAIRVPPTNKKEDIFVQLI